MWFLYTLISVLNPFSAQAHREPSGFLANFGDIVFHHRSMNHSAKSVRSQLGGQLDDMSEPDFFWWAEIFSGVGRMKSGEKDKNMREGVLFLLFLPN